jgi:hypothetical protein
MEQAGYFSWGSSVVLNVSGAGTVTDATHSSRHLCCPNFDTALAITLLEFALEGHTLPHPQLPRPKPYVSVRLFIARWEVTFCTPYAQGVARK